MATWITHLRIASDLLHSLPSQHADWFAMGSIAPDSGIPDEKWQTFTPPVQVTHFQTSPPCAYQTGDLLFYRRYLQRPSLAPEVYSFRLGYFCHLVTDNLWSELVGKPTMARFQAEFAADENFIWEVKKDWYGLDFCYLRDHPADALWQVFLGCEYTANALDFIPPPAVQERIRYIKAYYTTVDDTVRALYRRTYDYLSRAEMNQFVFQAVEVLLRAYQALWGENRQPAPSSQSVLEEPWAGSLVPVMVEG